jgi:methanethiol S-methyltransferase
VFGSPLVFLVPVRAGPANGRGAIFPMDQPSVDRPGDRRGSVQPRSLAEPPAPAAHASSAFAKAIAWGSALLFVLSLGFFLYSYGVRFGVAATAANRLRAIVIDVALFSVFALHHSLFARTPFRAWVRSVFPPALERSVYTALASVLFFAVCWWWQPVQGVLYRLSSPWNWLAFAVQLTGILFTFLGARALDVLDLAGVRQVLGARLGHAPLTTSGVYGFVRHPLYFGWALLVCAVPTMTGTRAVFAIVSTLYVAIAIPWEERGLVETFGAAYEGYRRKVRSRMVPGLY